MRSVVTDRVEWSVSRSVTVISPARLAELIEIPLGFWTQVGPRNHGLDEVQIPIRGNFEVRKDGPCKVQGRSAVSCAKTAEPIEMPFGLWAQETIITWVQIVQGDNF